MEFEDIRWKRKFLRGDKEQKFWDSYESSGNMPTMENIIGYQDLTTILYVETIGKIPKLRRIVIKKKKIKKIIHDVDR